jgi:hypothetical protein
MSRTITPAPLCASVRWCSKRLTRAGVGMRIGAVGGCTFASAVTESLGPLVFGSWTILFITLGTMAGMLVGAIVGFVRSE